MVGRKDTVFVQIGRHGWPFVSLQDTLLYALHLVEDAHVLTAELVPAEFGSIDGLFGLDSAPAVTEGDSIGHLEHLDRPLVVTGLHLRELLVGPPLPKI